MAGAFVQAAKSAGNAQTTGPTITTTAGNQLFLVICYDNAGTVTITGGGTWGIVGTSQNDAGNGQKVETWFCGSATGGSTTPSLTGSHQAVTIVLAEFSGGASTIDVSNTAKAFAANVVTSNAVTPTNGGSQTATFTEGTTGHTSTVQIAAIKDAVGTGEIIIGNFGDTSGTQASIGAGSGWTLPTNGDNLGVGGQTGATGFIYKIVTGGGVTNFGFFRMMGY